MNTQKSLSVLSLGLAATSFASQADALTQLETVATENSELQAMEKAALAECGQPGNRDYHAVLEAFSDEASDEYKFAGCGSAI